MMIRKKQTWIITIPLIGFLLAGVWFFGIWWNSHDAREESHQVAQRALAYLNRQPLRAQDLTDAIRLAQRAQQLDPSNERPYFVLAMAALEQQRTRAAADYLRRAILRAPEDLTFRPMLADILLTLGEPAEAQAHLEWQEARRPDDANVLVLIAECHRQQNQTAAAKIALQAAMAIDSHHRKAHLALAQLELEEGRFAEAAKHAQAVLDEDAHHPAAKSLLHAAQQRLKVPVDRVAQGELQESSGTSNVPAPLHFTDVTQSVAVRFHHTNGQSAQRYLPEILGGGVAIFDYDGDGWMDLYFVNATSLPVREGVQGPTSALYRNRGDGTFEDRTTESGMGYRGFGAGATVGDYDNDGAPDVYVTCYGPNVLFHNNGDGTFRDVSLEAHVADEGMGTGAAWLDADEDGDLDLYVVNYAVYDVAHPLPCTHPGIGNIYCGVQRLTPAAHVFYVNDGDGAFHTATAQAGIARTDGKGMGVVVADFNRDGHVDLYVANDTTPNFLFWGTGRLAFEDGTDSSGAALNKDGQAEGSMGIALGDLTGDGWPEIFVTNYWLEHNTLYQNLAGYFADVTDRSGVGLRSRQAVGWGTVLADFDHDTQLDLFVANGHFYDWRGEHEPLRQLPEIWRGVFSSPVPRFDDVSRLAGEYFGRRSIGRGVAAGDLNNDGDLDVVISHWGEAATVLGNDLLSPSGRSRGIDERARSAATENHPLPPAAPSPAQPAWSRLRLIGVASNRDAIGAMLTLDLGHKQLHRQVTSGGSYLSTNDQRVSIGLGDAPQIERLEIRWPSGLVQEWKGVEINTELWLLEGNPEIYAP